jgi:hypothetical protein
MSETLTLADANVSGAKRPRTLSDNLSITDDPNRVIQMIVDDMSIALSDETVGWRRLVRRMDEAISLVDSIVKALSGSGGIVVTKVMSESLVLADAVGNEYLLRVRQTSDAMTVTDAITRALTRVRVSGDVMDMNDSTVRVMRLNRVSSEGFTLSDEAIRALQLDQLQPTNLRFGVGPDPFRFGHTSPFVFGGR